MGLHHFPIKIISNKIIQYLLKRTQTVLSSWSLPALFINRIIFFNKLGRNGMGSFPSNSLSEIWPLTEPSFFQICCSLTELFFNRGAGYRRKIVFCKTLVTKGKFMPIELLLSNNKVGNNCDILDRFNSTSINQDNFRSLLHKKCL